jgi:prepilin-type N-terminal cleavage/methylation domain-containing protein
MAGTKQVSRGFTLIELLTVIALMLILATLAMPAFTGLRQRSALRGSADATLAFWNQARFEAVKRNEMVKVGVFIDADGAACLGAATTRNSADTVPCDCRTAAPATNACDVMRYPADMSEWNGVDVVDITLGGSGSLVASRPAVIEPMRTMLTEPADVGTLTLSAQSGAATYELKLAIDRLGRGHLCESADAMEHLPGFEDRRCND